MTADSTPSAPPQLSRKILRDDVYDTLLEMLLDSRIKAGSSLSIDALARQLGVSPTPVREALVQLEHTGLVSRAALKGYRVAPPLSPEQMAELVDARMVVELAAIERAAGRAAEVVPALRAAHARHAGVIAEMGALGDDSAHHTAASMRRYFDADWGFHTVIMQSSGNRYLLQMLEGLGTHVHRLRQAVGHGVSDASTALHEHAEILYALESERPQDAVEAMRRHLQGVRCRAVADEENADHAD
ncbi:GntR family transcriptional regulator [Zhihengliuella sp.]|uniref:GntR family transcriptional regulator n=1 Tax=Zhihengliuella sp. TaxID=1954483 RepID=UPI002810F103|nr:GntR family transcriptional regulator [Zhihengliuella sp.]